MEDGKVTQTTMGKLIDVPGRIAFHVAIDEDNHNIVLMMIGTNNSKKIRMLCAINELDDIDKIIDRMQRAKADVNKLRDDAQAKQEALKDARFIDTNVVDFIKWKKFAGIDLGPIGKIVAQQDERAEPNDEEGGQTIDDNNGPRAA